MGNMVLPWIPVVLVIVAIQSFFVLGIGFLLSVLNVYFRDVQHLVVDRADGALLHRRRSSTRSRLVPKHTEICGMDDPAARDLQPQPARACSSSATATRCTTCASRRSCRSSYLIAWSIVLMAIGLAVFQKLDRRLAEEV